MKRCSIILCLAVAMIVSPAVSAQEIVIDPSQIAASAVNTADQIDYMMDQLSELANLGDKLNGVKEYIDNVFGEDGIGGKAISVLQDLGTLERLAKSFNDTIELTVQYAEQLKSISKYSLSDANMMLAYLNTAKKQAELAIETAKKLLSTLGFTKKEKKDELEKMVKEMEEANKKLAAAMEIETEATVMAEGTKQFIDFIDKNSSTEEFVAATSAYGTAKGSASSSLGVISLILIILGIGSAAWAFVIYVRGGITGDPTADNAFIRVAAAFIGGTFILNLLAKIFELNI